MSIECTRFMTVIIRVFIVMLETLQYSIYVHCNKRSINVCHKLVHTHLLSRISIFNVGQSNLHSFYQENFKNFIRTRGSEFIGN